MLELLTQQIMGGQFQNSPQMQVFNQMMSGKTQTEQIQTLINLAKSRGLDINKKVFSERDLQTLKLK